MSLWESIEIHKIDQMYVRRAHIMLLYRPDYDTRKYWLSSTKCLIFAVINPLVGCNVDLGPRYVHSDFNLFTGR